MVVAEVLRLVRHHCSTAREGTLVDLGATLHLALVRSEDGPIHSLQGEHMLGMHSAKVPIEIGSKNSHKWHFLRLWCELGVLQGLLGWRGGSTFFDGFLGSHSFPMSATWPPTPAHLPRGPPTPTHSPPRSSAPVPLPPGPMTPARPFPGSPTPSYPPPGPCTPSHPPSGPDIHLSLPPSGPPSFSTYPLHCRHLSSLGIGPGCLVHSQVQL